jgi:hypothetical protein
LPLKFEGQSFSFIQGLGDSMVGGIPGGIDNAGDGDLGAGGQLFYYFIFNR